MDGILVIDKPQGITSHDVVDIVRKRFNIRRVGHAGTLDPMATGVLIVLLGKATSKSSMLICDDKEYVATLFLGRCTDSQDSTGRVIEEKEIGAIDIDSVRKVLDSFLGEIEQIPPMISAKKYKGKRLYQLARKGKSVERSPCRIKIHEIRLLDFNQPEIVFRVSCSKGTYIRTLCEDIGRSLGYPAHMSALVRSRSGRFLLEQARALDTISEKDIQAI